MINGEKVIDRPIRWGMVGGGRGSNIGYIHRSAALRDNTFRLIAGAFDIDPERGRIFGSELGVDSERCYPDYKTMFEAESKRDDGIEAVSIATPNKFHFEISKAALEAGFHVVCEKPLCFTTEEAETLVNISKKKNLVMGVTYGYSCHQTVHQARKMIENGALGDIRIIEMQFAYGGFNDPIENEIPAAKWRLDPAHAGPSFILGDVGTHSLHMAEIMIPGLEIKNLLCAKQSFIPTRKLEDNAHVFINFTNGAFGNLWASSLNCGAMHGHKIRIVGSKASLEWYDDKPNHLFFYPEGQPEQILHRGTGYFHPEANRYDRISAGHHEGLFESWSNMYLRFGLAMNAKRKGDEEFLKTHWYPNVNEGAVGVKFVEKCVESAEAGSVWVNF